jgi:multicomponent Na+:H+ antiporter subunit D
MRVIGFVFGPALLRHTAVLDILALACAATIVVGSLIALQQDNLKRRLAYSTVVHLSYIVLGASLLSPLGMAGAAFHLLAHGLAKITLFFCAGAIYAHAHVERVSQFRGLGRTMPVTFAAFALASLALTGLPGLAGFASKLLLAQGAVQAQAVVPLAVLLGGSLLTAAYLLPVVAIAFFQAPPARPRMVAGARHLPPGRQGPARVREARPSLLVPLVLTACLALAFGMVPPAVNLLSRLVTQVAASIFGGLP